MKFRIGHVAATLLAIAACALNGRAAQGGDGPGDKKASQVEAVPEVVVLSVGERDEMGARPTALRLIGPEGKLLRTIGGFQVDQGIGGVHRVALNSSRIYVAESVAGRITALNLSGDRVWQVEAEEGPSSIAVDRKTGNIWCQCGTDLAHPKTLVFDPEGKRVAEYPWGGRLFAGHYRNCRPRAMPRQ